ncbi:MAG: SRPBCC family protein [Longimicrobiales bacterium]
MTVYDEAFVKAPPDACFRVAADVERWPLILPHYRWVRFLDRRSFGTGRVEMAAWRNFGGPIRYPTWWVSEMRIDEHEPAVFYRHIDGLTRGMEVKWEFMVEQDGTHVRIAHSWDGPAWPIVGGFAWRAVIAPHFVSAIATGTLAGIARETERLLTRKPGTVERAQ